MGRYMRKCKGVTGEIAVVEVAELSSDVPHGGVTTRSQAALAKEKKNRRRLRTTSNGGEFSSDMTSYICTRRRMMIQPALTTLNTTFEMPVNIRGVFSSVENINDLDPQPASCCLSNASGGLFENRMEEAADPTLDRGCGKVDNSLTFPDAITERNSGTVEFRVVEKSRDLMNSSGRMTSEANSGGSEMKMPSESEIEEFFAAAEKDLHKRFSEKYNFDVVKDVPLEGRYEWVHVKP